MATRAVRRPTGVDRTPVGINVGIGSGVMVVAGLVGASIPSAAWRLTVIALAVAGFAATTLDEVALAPVAALGFAILNGFLIDRYGQLSWHGSADLGRLMLLVVAGGVGLGFGEAWRLLRNLRERWLAELEKADD
jgi:hypothetical protein